MSGRLRTARISACENAATTTHNRIPCGVGRRFLPREKTLDEAEGTVPTRQGSVNVGSPTASSISIFGTDNSVLWIRQ